MVEVRVYHDGQLVERRSFESMDDAETFVRSVPDAPGFECVFDAGPADELPAVDEADDDFPHGG